MKFSRRWLWLLLAPAFILAAIAVNPRLRDSAAHLLYKEGLMTGYHRFSPKSFFAGPQLELAQAIADADLNKVKGLAPKIDLNVHGQRNLSLLTFAINQINPADEKDYNDRFRIISALVKAGADINDSNPRKEDATPLSISLQAISPNYLQALLDGGLSPDYMIDNQQPILFEVDADPLLASAKLLVERGANVNERDSLKQTAIFRPLDTGQLEVVNYLLDHGADPKVIDDLGISFAYALSLQLQYQVPNSPFKPKYLAIRDRIIKQGVKWPPDPPEVERDRMRARGETPVVPHGQTR